ncbi:hypothetical protein PVK06_026994 [Gossypium arboreum]|uniref:Arabidopsis retrotransposon Orf1 C-terminal domain-containing protein n=1 Tax=Gossypium arboreum TaxID=29729 RepID=A0ABR0NZ27_GOSAR|nr:hypothetical protein PVK06_026994 [Gossypium arboreum]
MSVPKFDAAMRLYNEEFMSVENFLHLHRHIHYTPSHCWTELTASQKLYDASRSKATSLSPILRYLYALLAHTLTSRRESTGVVSTHDPYFL